MFDPLGENIDRYGLNSCWYSYDVCRSCVGSQACKSFKQASPLSGLAIVHSQPCRQPCRQGQLAILSGTGRTAMPPGPTGARSGTGRTGRACAAPDTWARSAVPTNTFALASTWATGIGILLYLTCSK